MMRFITYCISPTIAGYKPASVITISNSYKQMYELWRLYGDEYIKTIALKVFCMQQTSEKAVLIFYDEEKLSRALIQEENKKFLSRFGYSQNMSVQEHLQHLSFRFSFHVCPHEMGLFLGIPLGDVEGFMKCGGHKYMYCGYWKVYNNVEEAIYIFDNYNKCKCNFINLLKNDIPIQDAIKALKNI